MGTPTAGKTVQRIAPHEGRCNPSLPVGEWAWVFQGTLVALSHDPAMTLQHWRMLAYLIGQLRYGERLSVRQCDMMAAYGLSQGNVSKVMQVLIDRQVVLREYDGRNCVYSLSSLIAYKGHGARLPQRRAIQHRKQAQQRKRARQSAH